jgi:hypothetical protein
MRRSVQARISALLAHLVVCWAWVPPSHHWTPRSLRRAENDYLASLANRPKRPGLLRRAWRRLRGAPAALSLDEVLRLVVLGHGRAEAEAMASYFAQEAAKGFALCAG